MNQVAFDFTPRPRAPAPDSQAGAILAALQSGRRLTAIDALRDFGCFRLAARILELRQAGHPVTSEETRLPNGKRIATYWLDRLGGRA